MASVSSPSSAEGDRPSKKPRMLACRRCRHRKQKCDEERPCTNCQRSGDECVESEPAPRPQVTVEHVKALEERLAWFEAGTSGGSPSNRPYPPTASSVQRVPQSEHSLSPRAAAAHRRRKRPSNTFPRHTRHRSVILDSPSHSPSHSPREESPDAAQHVSSDSPRVSSNVSNRRSSYNATSHHLPQTTEDTLLNTYRDRVQAQYPFFHWDSFLAWHSEWKAGYRTQSWRQHAFFVNLVYSTSLLLLPWPGLSTLDANDFYEEAVSLSKYVLDDDNPVVGAQARLLFALHAIHSNSTRRVLSRVSEAVRYCVNVQFHLSEAESTLNDAATRFENQLRRRCFWSAYCMDRMIMISFELPPCIPDSMITAKLYANVADVDLMAAAADQTSSQGSEILGSTKYTCVSAPLHILQCRRIQSEMVQYTLSWEYEDRYKDASDWRSRILSELESYKARAQRFSNPLSKGHTSHRWIAMIYHYTLLMLYRPTKQGVLGPAGDWSVQASCQACLIFRKCQRDRQIAQSWLGLLVQFQSGITLLYCLWATPPEYRTESYDSPDISDALRACSNILAIMADRWPNADCLRDVFESLASEIPLVDRPRLPPRNISPSSVAAIKKDLAEVRALVVNRHVLRMIEEMVNEEFPRSGSANDPHRQTAPLNSRSGAQNAEKPPVSAHQQQQQQQQQEQQQDCDGYLYSMPFSGFEFGLPFSTRAGAANADVPDLSNDELLTFPGAFDVDQWMLHGS